MDTTTVSLSAAANDSKHEEWRSLAPAGLPDYEASSLGRVRSLLTLDAVTGAPYIVSPGRGSDGYLTVFLTPPGVKPRSFKLHRLIAIAFHGRAPSRKHIVRHLNDVRADCRASNLAWGTRLDNWHDCIRNGGAFKPRTRRGRLSAANVRSIRRRAAEGEPLKRLAAEYEMSYASMAAIVARNTYTWVLDDVVATERARIEEEQSRRQARGAHRAARELAEIAARERARPPQGQRRRAA